MRIILIQVLMLLGLLVAGCTDAGKPASHASSGDLGPNPQITGGVAPATEGEASVSLQQAMFGAGCFWGVEATFRKVPGVVDAAVGYSGGKTDNPSYQQVCYDATGHAEVVHLTFDPAKVTYEQLLEIFFKMHDPTQLNRQGPDIGDQYRSAVFTYSPEQASAARAAIERLTAAKRFRRPIVTTIEPAPTFWKAEDYHQRYLEKRGLDNCHVPE